MRLFSKALVVFLIALTLTGCGKKQIWVDESAQYELTALTDEELSNDVYYVKDGAYFYATYMPKGTVTSVSTSTDASRVLWTDEDETLIPTLYSDELVALQTNDETTLDEIVLERFVDSGYSIGLYNGTFDDDGYLCYSTKENIVKTSDAYNYMGGLSAETIRIIAIDNEPVTSDMVNNAGIITGLEEGKEYTIEYYAGSYYSKATIIADEHFYSSSSIRTDATSYLTKHGYMAFEMPDSAQSGYYLVNGEGVYRYYACDKGDEESGDLCEESDINTSNSQQYSINLEESATNVSINVVYDSEDTTSDENITCMLTAPNEMQYEMTTSNHQSTITLSEAMAGKWLINITPIALEVEDITIENAADTTATKTETFTFTLEEGSNIDFYALYEGTGEIWGTVKTKEGDAVSFENASSEDGYNKITASYPYLEAGEYTVTLYHYTDTRVVEVNYEKQQTQTQEEILNIEE